MLRLPIDFFQHRLVGDVTDRVSSVDRIAKNLTERFLVLLIDMAMSAVLLIAMFLYDVILAALVVGLGVLHAILSRLLNAVRETRTQTMRREQGMLIGVGMQMVSHIDTLRMTGARRHVFISHKWSGQQAKELESRQLNAEVVSINTALPGFIGMLRAAVILGVGAGLVAGDQMSLGTLVGFYILAEMFLTPIGRFIEFADERKALETDLQRLDDIASTDVDPVFRQRKKETDSISTLNGRMQLAGHLELRNVTFGFNKNKPPLINDLSLIVKPGQRVAIVGPSGSGKSTLARLVSGMFQPWEGEILLRWTSP